MELRLGILLTSVAFLSGCANADWTTYNKTQEFKNDNNAHAVFIDAKQRALISNVKADSNHNQIRRFCAEPSPDALSSIAASMGLNLSVANKGDASYNQAFTEGVVNIGLRTQTIQIMRDITYRDCEAFINGGLTDFGLETMQRRFQSTLVAVLAIEQLTGAIKAPTVALGGTAKGIDADALAAAIKLVDNAEAAAQDASDKYDAAKKKSDTAKSDLDGYAPAIKDQPTEAEKNKQKDLNKTAEDLSAVTTHAEAESIKRDKDLSDAKALRIAAASAGKSGVTNVSIESSSQKNQLTNENVAAVAGAVSEIVNDTLSLGFGREVCTTLFGQIVTGKLEQVQLATAPESPLAKLISTCMGNLEETKNTYAAQSALTNSQAKINNACAKTIDQGKENSACSTHSNPVASKAKSSSPPTPSSTATEFQTFSYTKPIKKSKRR